MYTSDESTFAHDCSGSRLTQQLGDKTFYLMNPSSSNLVTLWQNSVPNHAQYDAIFEDNANDVWGVSGTPCNYTPQAWLQASVNEATAFGYPVVYNGASGSGIGMNDAPNVLGGMTEKCYTSSSGAYVQGHRTYGPVWQGLENTELQMAQAHKLFFCQDTSYTSASDTALRIYDVASFLLTYDPGTSVLVEFYGTPSGVRVEPESKLVPLYPAIPAPQEITSLQVSSNVYGRQYNACYVWGSNVGPCATVVNTDPSASHPFPYAGYGHTLTLSGEGIFDGGSFSTGGAPPTSLAPLTAAVAFR